MDLSNICENISVNSKNHVCFAGQDVCDLARDYGTPLYLMDEERIRRNCKVYAEAVREFFGEGSMVLYASKACSFARMYSIINDEGLGTDVVSSGELFTALRVGFSAENMFFHSNNKTDDDIYYAIDNGVGHFVVDNAEELEAINRIAGEKGIKQGVLLRLTPGIDPHTYAAVATGKVDSKFGSAIETGQAEEITGLGRLSMIFLVASLTSSAARATSKKLSKPMSSRPASTVSVSCRLLNCAYRLGAGSATRCLKWV